MNAVRFYPELLINISVSGRTDISILPDTEILIDNSDAVLCDGEVYVGQIVLRNKQIDLMIHTSEINLYSKIGDNLGRQIFLETKLQKIKNTLLN